MSAFNFSLYKAQKQTYLQKAETFDRIFSGLVKVNYARFLSYDVVAQMEEHVYGLAEGDLDYVKEIFQKVYGLFELNMLYNMQVHRLQPAEVVIAIMFHLDVQQKDIIIKIVEQVLKCYGDQLDLVFDTVSKVGENIIDSI